MVVIGSATALLVAALAEQSHLGNKISVFQTVGCFLMSMRRGNAAAVVLLSCKESLWLCQSCKVVNDDVDGASASDVLMG